MKEQIKCYCGHTITCDCIREVETALDWFPTKELEEWFNQVKKKKE